MLLRKDFHGYNMNRKIFMYATLLVIIGGINYLSIGILRHNIIQKVFANEKIAEIVYILIGLSALYLAFKRDTYLPFLGEAVLPCDTLPLSIPKDATKKVAVQVKPNSKVIYWATEPSTTGEVTDYKAAYGHFLNSGVALSNAEGIAELQVREPQPYYVPYKGILPVHVHYRVCEGNGFVGKVKTIFLNTGVIV